MFGLGNRRKYNENIDLKLNNEYGISTKDNSYFPGVLPYLEIIDQMRDEGYTEEEAAMFIASLYYSHLMRDGNAAEANALSSRFTLASATDFGAGKISMQRLATFMAVIEKANADYKDHAMDARVDETAGNDALTSSIGRDSCKERDFDEELQQLEQDYDDGEIDHLEYKTKRNSLVMDQATSSYQSTQFDYEHAKNVIAYDDGDITLEQHLENYRALLLAEVTKVLMGRLSQPFLPPSKETTL